MKSATVSEDRTGQGGQRGAASGVRRGEPPVKTGPHDPAPTGLAEGGREGQGEGPASGEGVDPKPDFLPLWLQTGWREGGPRSRVARYHSGTAAEGAARPTAGVTQSNRVASNI